MKFWKKFLFLILIVGGVWGLLGRWGKEKFKVAEQRKDEQEPIRFAVMSDIHSDWENFRKALKKAKENKGNKEDKGFVILTGDLTTLGKKSELIEAKKILDESGLKYFVIPGNHDIWWGRKYKQDVWKEVFGESFQSFKVDGKKFILVNNADGIGGLNQFKVDGSESTQTEWLKRETEECQKIYCLVFMHMPLNHPSSLHVMGEENPAVASEAAELVGLLVKNQVKEVFAGHLHFSSSYEIGGLKTTIVGAITSDRNFQSPKFLEVTLGEKEFKEDVFLAD